MRKLSVEGLLSGQLAAGGGSRALRAGTTRHDVGLIRVRTAHLLLLLLALNSHSQLLVQKLHPLRVYFVRRAAS